MGECTVLTGWAFPPERFAVPENSEIIDTTLLTADPSAFESIFSRLKVDSAERTIIGFSMGSLAVQRLAQQLPFKRVVLLAPTLSFCTDETHRFGTPAETVNSMIESLKLHRGKTLSRFYRNCGASEPAPLPYSTEQLISGLLYLRDEKIPALPFAGSPELLVLHGEQDRIIPVEAGRECSKQYGAEFRTVPGGHIAAPEQFFMSYF